MVWQMAVVPKSRTCPSDFPQDSMCAEGEEPEANEAGEEPEANEGGEEPEANEGGEEPEANEGESGVEEAPERKDEREGVEEEGEEVTKTTPTAVVFGKNVLTSFPEPAIVGQELDTQDDQFAYDKLVEKALTITKPWPWRETDGMSHAQWKQYAVDLLTDPELALCISPWRSETPSQRLTGGVWDNLVELVLWVVAFPEAGEIMGKLMGRWFTDSPNSYPIERVVRRQRAFVSTYTLWNTKHCIKSLPSWVWKAALPERRAARPVSTMMDLEVFCQLTLAQPAFMRTKLQEIRRSIIDCDVARDHMRVMVQQVLPTKKILTCQKTARIFTVERVFTDHEASTRLYSGHAPFHHLVYRFYQDVAVIEQLDEGYHRSKKRKIQKIKDEDGSDVEADDDDVNDGILALPRSPCMCCKIPIGQTLLGWIRCWLEPGMYIFETTPHASLNVQFATWKPWVFSSFQKLPDKIGLLTTPSAEAKSIDDKELWLWTAAKLEDCSEQQRVCLCNDDFGFRFEPRFGSVKRTLPLVGFAPAFIALLARRELVELAGLLYDLADIVYEYMKCNI